MYRWILIASVPDESTIPQLLEFGKWLIKYVAKISLDLSIEIAFEETEAAHFYAPVDDAQRIYEIYDTIASKHPDVSLVLHILPRKESAEYQWMKTLSRKIGVAHQGVLEENALNRFESLKVDEVVGNITIWVQRSLMRLATGRREKETRPFRLTIGDGPSSSPEKLRYPKRPQEISEVVSLIHQLKIEALEDQENRVSTISISGLPAGTTTYRIASIFQGLHVENVIFNGELAYVSFVNKFHAYQAVDLYGSHLFDEEHPLVIRPLCKEVEEMLEKLRVNNKVSEKEENKENL